MLPSGTPETPKPYPATPGLTVKMASGHLHEFLQSWLAFSPAALSFHPSPPSHGDSLFSFLPVPSLHKSKGPILSPFSQPLATRIFIDLSKINWTQGLLAFGHAES